MFHDLHLDLTFVCHFVVHLDIHIFTHYFSKEIEGARGCNQIKTLEYVTTFECDPLQKLCDTVSKLAEFIASTESLYLHEKD